jgi:peroxiredoxin Q/BCP
MSKAVLTLAALALVVGLALPAAAEDKAAQDKDAAKEAKNMTIAVGDSAPDFELPKPGAAEGSKETVKLSDLKGEKNVLLAFYPKAFTGGCTKQLCGYRDDFSQFESADTVVVAISTDEQAESDRFKKEHQMPFVVLGDPDHSVIDAYGIPMKDYNGQKFVQRAVVLVDKDGIVRHVDLEYSIDQDKQPLYDAIAKLAEEQAAGSQEKS